jgi:hypothetical protein
MTPEFQGNRNQHFVSLRPAPLENPAFLPHRPGVPLTPIGHRVSIHSLSTDHWGFSAHGIAIRTADPG